MNLAELLSYTDIQHLHCIANTYECQCSGHSKNALLQTILSTISRKDILKNRIESLTLTELRLLNSLLFDKEHMFSKEELLGRTKYCMFEGSEHCQQNEREIVSKFKKWGWLYHGYTVQDKFLFHIPQDLKKRLRDVLVNRLEQLICIGSEPSSYEDHGCKLSIDIMHFLRYLQQVKRLPLTAGFVLPQRQLTKIIQQMTVRETHVHKHGWRFGYGRMFKMYPNRFSFIYDFCCHFHYIDLNDQCLSITDQAQSFFTFCKTKTDLQLYQYWLHLYRPPIPNLHVIVNWIQRLTTQWVTVETLKQTLCPFIRPYYYDSPETILDERILQMLYYLGIILRGVHEEKGDVVKLSIRGLEVAKGGLV
jgi:hypothetical protein